MSAKHWVGLDYKIASDYTDGTPEVHRSRLRSFIGLPHLLPGETDALSGSKQFRQAIINKFLAKRNLPGIVYKGKRRRK